MILKELAKEIFGKKMDDKFIEIAEVKDGVLQKYGPDFADEYLETHGNRRVCTHFYHKSIKILQVTLYSEDGSEGVF